MSWHQFPISKTLVCPKFSDIVHNAKGGFGRKPMKEKISEFCKVNLNERRENNCYKRLSDI